MEAEMINVESKIAHDYLQIQERFLKDDFFYNARMEYVEDDYWHEDKSRKKNEDDSECDSGIFL